MAESLVFPVIGEPRFYGKLGDWESKDFLGGSSHIFDKIMKLFWAFISIPEKAEKGFKDEFNRVSSSSLKNIFEVIIYLMVSTYSLYVISFK